MKWILKYLKITLHVGLVYDQSNNISKTIIYYVDSNLARDLDRRKSLIGYVFALCGSVISWKITLQSPVVLSITEAKYMTTKVVKKVFNLKVWLMI